MSLFDDASLVITPSGYKEGKLYSIKPTDGSGDLSVTRATTATRVNSAGLVEEVPVNLASYSEQFDNSYWDKVNISVLSNNIASPNGSTTADKITEDTANSIHGLYNLTAYSSVTTATSSIYFKKGTRQFFSIKLQIGSNSYTQVYDANNLITTSNSSNGLTSVSSSIIDFGNGWVRATLTGTNPTGSADSYSIFCLSNSGTPTFNGTNFNPTYTGTGSDYAYIWGAQVVEGTSAKDYYPTTTRLNIPRLDYTNGSCPSILVEPQRTNSARWSEDFSNGFWSKDSTTTLTSNADISPDGTQNADRFESPSNIKGLFSYGISSSETISIYVKAGNSTNVGKSVNFFSANAQQNFVLTNNWQRISVSGTASNLIALYPSDSNGFTNILIWGAQAELGSYATSYIPTTSASVTRNADVISKTGISSLIGQTEGTIFVDVIPVLNAPADIVALNLSTSNSVSIAFITNTITVNIFNSSNFFQMTGGSYTKGNRYKIALVYKNNNNKIFVNGVLKTTNTSNLAFNGALNDLFNYSTNYYEGVSALNYNSTQLYKTALTDEQCIQLTTI